MLNEKKVSLANAAAVIVSNPAPILAASTQKMNNSSNYKALLTFTTKDEHNFFPGARVNITGLSVSSSFGPTSFSANFANAAIFSILDTKTFTVLSDDTTYVDGITVSGPGMAYLINGALSSVDLVYGYPDLSAT